MVYSDTTVSSYNKPNHFTSTLEHALSFLKRMVNDHVCMILISLREKKSALGNIDTWQNNVCFQESLTHAVIGCADEDLRQCPRDNFEHN